MILKQLRVKLAITQAAIISTAAKAKYAPKYALFSAQNEQEVESPSSEKE